MEGMPKDGMRVCFEIMERLHSHGFKKQVTRKGVEQIIKQVAGFDKRTIEKYVNHLIEFGFLQIFNHKTFEIQWDQVEKYKFEHGVMNA